jgi:hypothetical protein
MLSQGEVHAEIALYSLEKLEDTGGLQEEKKNNLEVFL